MRKIDWEKALSDEDIAWLRQAGFMSEEKIAAHQEQFGGDVPEVETGGDPLTKDALDPETRMAERVEGTGTGSPELVDPTATDSEDSDTPEEDDYDSWKVNELEAEVAARNDLAEKRDEVSPVVVEGTGKDGAVRKADLVKGLRLWDQENPDALQD